MSEPTPIYTAANLQPKAPPPLGAIPAGESIPVEIVTPWIPVSERLPESTGRYLVWVENEIQFANFAPGNPDGEKWISDDMVDYINITHWMPLPERP